MKKLFVLFSLGFMCAAGLFAALNYHFILTSSDGLLVKRKSELTFTDTFVDTRKWGITDYIEHPSVAKHLVSKKLDSLIEGASDAKDKASEEAKKLMDQSKEAIGDALERAGKNLKK